MSTLDKFWNTAVILNWHRYCRLTFPIGNRGGISVSGTVYRQRKPQSSPYYQCVEDHFETFERVYDLAFGSMAAYRIQRLLRQKNPPMGKDVHGKPGSLHYLPTPLSIAPRQAGPAIILARMDDLRSGSRIGDLSIQKQPYHPRV